MTQWKTKNEEQKEYKTSFGSTDYNIPTIGYKSAFFICGLSILVVVFVPSMFAQIFNGVQWPGILVSSLLIGFIISYAQHLCNLKRDYVSHFGLLQGYLASLHLRFYSLHSMATSLCYETKF